MGHFCEMKNKILEKMVSAWNQTYTICIEIQGFKILRQLYRVVIFDFLCNFLARSCGLNTFL